MALALVEQVNRMIFSKQIDYDLVKRVNAMLKKGDRAQVVYLILPDLEEMVSRGDHTFLLSGYEIAEKTLRRVKDDTCCVVSVILDPRVSRMEIGDKVVLEKGLRLVVMNPYRHTQSASGYQIYAGALRTHDEPELTADDLYLRGDSDLEELSRIWIDEMELKREALTEDNIEKRIMINANELALEPELVDILRSKMTRRTHRIRCVQDDEVEQTANRWAVELSATLYKELSNQGIKDFVEDRGKGMTRLMRKQIENGMLAIKYDVNCKREAEFRAKEKKAKDKLQQKASDAQDAYSYGKNVLIQLGRSPHTQKALREISMGVLKAENGPLIDYMSRVAGYLSKKIPRPTPDDIDLFIDNQTQTTPEIARLVKSIMKNILRV